VEAAHFGGRWKLGGQSDGSSTLRWAVDGAAGPAVEHTSVGEVGAVSIWRGPWRGTKPKEEPGTPKAATSKGYNGLVDGVKPRGWLPSGPSIELLLAAGLCEVWLVEQ
jgi:hypothetical protein